MFLSEKSVSRSMAEPSTTVHGAVPEGVGSSYVMSQGMTLDDVNTTIDHTDYDMVAPHGHGDQQSMMQDTQAPLHHGCSEVQHAIHQQVNASGDCRSRTYRLRHFHRTTGVVSNHMHLACTAPSARLIGHRSAHFTFPVRTGLGASGSALTTRSTDPVPAYRTPVLYKRCYAMGRITNHFV